MTQLSRHKMAVARGRRERQERRLAEYENENNALSDWRPIPDPTRLTTQQLMREIANMKELFETRLDAMDKAVTLLQAIANRSPTIGEVVSQFTEKFQGINTQFKERDLRVEQTARESKVAVDAAFSAQKEAVSEQNKSAAAAIAKSEANTTKQIDAIGSQIVQIAKATDDKIDDLKGRLGLIEGRSAGVQQGWGWITSAAAAIAALAGAIIALFFRAAG